MREIVDLAECEAYCEFQQRAEAIQSGDPISVERLCSIWQRSRPVVAFLLGFPLLPTRVRAFLGMLTAALDGLCTLPAPPAESAPPAH